LFNGPGPFRPHELTTTPFYVVHALLLILTTFGIRRRGRKLRKLYPGDQQEEVGT